MTLDEAINYLRKLVKYSAVPGQKHIDYTLVGVDEMPRVNLAMGTVYKAIQEGNISDSEFKTRVGLD